MHCPHKTHSSVREIAFSSPFVALNTLVGQIFVQRLHLEHVLELTLIAGDSKKVVSII